MGHWVSPFIRDEIVDYMRRYIPLTELPLTQFLGWLGVGLSKFYGWLSRYGKDNDHNGMIPRRFWLEAWEKQAIIKRQWVGP